MLKIFNNKLNLLDEIFLQEKQYHGCYRIKDQKLVSRED